MNKEKNIQLAHRVVLISGIFCGVVALLLLLNFWHMKQNEPLESKTIGGGADANIFFGKGIVAGVLGTGMTDVHTTDESVDLANMVKLTELLYTIACM